MRGQIPDTQTMEKQLGAAHVYLNSGSFSRKKDADVIAHARIHILQARREVVIYAIVNSMESSCPLVFRFEGNMQVK